MVPKYILFLGENNVCINNIPFKLLGMFIFTHIQGCFQKIVVITPKSSIFIGFSIINHPFWGIPIFGNTHICIAPRICMPPFPQRTRALKQIAPHAFDVQRPWGDEWNVDPPSNEGEPCFFPR